MSLWSKLGLADAATVAALRQELQELKTENQRLQQENMQQFQVILQSELSQIGQALAQSRQELSVQGAAAQRERQVISDALTAGQESDRGMMEQLLSVSEKLSAMKQQTEEQLSSLERQSSDDGISLKEAVRRLADNQTRNAEVLASMAQTVQELPGMKEYLYQLWDAMKLVWINDLLDHCEKGS